MAAERTWSRLLPPVPLGWLQLWHKPLRLSVAVAGIAFAVLLILMQLGFRSALFESTLRFHERFRYDIALFSTDSVFIVRPAPFTIRRLYEAMGSPDVESVSPVYIFPATWKNPWNNARRSINAVGVEPTRNVLDTPGFADNYPKLVAQDVVLFDASIRDNLRLYVPDATDDELIVALGQAAADFVMTRLPEGLDTRAGPGGRWLSGGERQRIGIARALLRKPGFLVLDEPTAALDTDTQAKLMEALYGLEHSMSVVLITHRAELLRLVDRVIDVVDCEIREVTGHATTR